MAAVPISVQEETVPVLISHTGKLDASPVLQGNGMPDINTHRLLLPSACAVLFSVYG